MTEQERLDLEQKAEYGRKMKVAQEVLSDFCMQQRVTIINSLENGDITNTNAMISNILALRAVSSLEKHLETYLQIGEISEKELNENGYE